MQIIYHKRYYYRFTIPEKYKDPNTKYPIFTMVFLESDYSRLLELGKLRVHTPFTKTQETTLKPQHAICIDRPHTNQDIFLLLASIPMHVDLRTINLDDYPEYFI